MDASISRLRHQDILTICVFTLLGLGVVMVQSASTTVTGDLDWQWSTMGAKHLKFALAAAIMFLAVSRFDYARLASGGSGRRSIFSSPIAWATGLAGLACLAV